MIARSELSRYLDELLRCGQFNDYAPNGIQVEGKAQIKRICTAVTASDDVIAQAIEWHADAVLVHHGYFWRGEDPVITGMKRQRIGKLIKNDLNLFAYHLPLDCHLELGNNACLAELLQLKSIETHKIGSIEDLLWSGELPKPMSGQEFCNVLAHQFSRTPIYIAGSDKPVLKVALCSGGAHDYIEDAVRLGVDAYISGEIAERTYYQAKELGIHYYSCGHHATERYGIQALGAHLAQKFSLEHLFIDSHNPI